MNKFKMMNIKPYITNFKSIEETIESILNDNLVDHSEKVHK